MPFLPILVKPGNNAGLSLDGVHTKPLPAFYMNDYSVIGLRVSDGSAAVALLADHRYSVIDRQGARGVTARSAGDISAIIGLLTSNGLAAEMADIAEQIYQG